MTRPCLIVAHPGHELRLFAWMETHRPLVCILTDGSGSTGEPRTEFSIRLIESCGATPGPVMGLLPDRNWYATLLAGDAGPFDNAAEAIASEAEPGALIVADPVEGYNPMHDLCAAVADRVAALINGSRATYSLIRPAGVEPPPLMMDPATEARKRAAAAAYAPLAHEVSALLGTHPEAVTNEHVFPHVYGWPRAAEPQPYYERLAASKTAAGTYAYPITYQEHVRPIALSLRQPGGT